MDGRVGKVALEVALGGSVYEASTLAVRTHTFAHATAQRLGTAAMCLRRLLIRQVSRGRWGLDSGEPLPCASCSLRVCVPVHKPDIHVQQVATARHAL
jgi:hypothetical protein